MTTRQRAFTAVAIVVALAAAYFAGTMHAPTRTVETVSVQRAVRTEYRERTASAATVKESSTVVAGPVRTVWRTAPASTPNCPPVMEVERIEGAREERLVSDASLVVKQSKDSLLNASEASVVSKTTERAAPRFAVIAGGGLRFPDPVRLVVTGRVEVRALGPFWLYAEAERPIVWAMTAPNYSAGIAWKATF